ncbi:MAG: DsrE family protein [Acidobacteria bacterium]|nr:DsrE family protein [Acidobacteriota bacterium]
MARYLLIDSRDLREYRGSQYILDLAASLKNKGNDVTLYLVENGALAARKGSELGSTLTGLAKNGITILAEDISLKARGISETAEGVKTSNMDELADFIVSGSDKLMWY